MKAFLILPFFASAILAQAPAQPKAPPKATPKAPTKTDAATKAPAKSDAAPKSAASRPNPLLNPESLRTPAPPVFRVKFTTTHGDFVVECTRAWSPLGADRFYNLVRNRFFNDAAFFRWAKKSGGKDFVVQFGIPANPAVAKAWQNANIKDEPVVQGNKKGTIVFAKTDAPNTRTTQLFINLDDNAFLDGMGFSAFGTIVEGMEVAQTLYSGYGESPDQGKLTMEGKAYTDKSFPKLDLIKSTTIIFPESAAPATKKAAPAGTKTGAPAGSKTGTAPGGAKTAAPPPPPPKK
jgi:peptidyl-prolyl cis-trans isomerase A (cyclophilin A)